MENGWEPVKIRMKTWVAVTHVLINMGHVRIFTLEQYSMLFLSNDYQTYPDVPVPINITWLKSFFDLSFVNRKFKYSASCNESVLPVTATSLTQPPVMDVCVTFSTSAWDPPQGWCMFLW